MSEVFSRALSFVLSHEGGYVNDPHDIGGETNFGICKRSYPTLDIKNLTPEQVEGIYYEDYWLAAKCDHLPESVAMLIFDSAVNQGIGAAAKCLQRASGSTQDGAIGPKTLMSMEAKVDTDLQKFLMDIASARAYRYATVRADLVERYNYGWSRRLFACYTQALNLLTFGE